MFVTKLQIQGKVMFLFSVFEIASTLKNGCQCFGNLSDCTNLSHVGDNLQDYKILAVWVRQLLQHMLEIKKIQHLQHFPHKV